MFEFLLCNGDCIIVRKGAKLEKFFIPVESLQNCFSFLDYMNVTPNQHVYLDRQLSLTLPIVSLFAGKILPSGEQFTLWKY